MCSYRLVYRFLKTNFHRIFSGKYLFLPFFHLISMLLTNNQTCNLLFWCLYMGRSGRDEYLELDICWKILYHIQSLWPHGKGERRGLSNVNKWGQERWSQKSLKMCRNLCWMVFYKGLFKNEKKSGTSLPASLSA